MSRLIGFCKLSSHKIRYVYYTRVNFHDLVQKFSTRKPIISTLPYTPDSNFQLITMIAESLDLTPRKYIADNTRRTWIYEIQEKKRSTRVGKVHIQTVDVKSG